MGDGHDRQIDRHTDNVGYIDNYQNPHNCTRKLDDLMVLNFTSNIFP